MGTSKSDLIKNLKSVAVAYCAAEDIPPKTLSHRVFDDGKKLDAILADKADLMTANFEKTMQWLSTNWPDGAVWPKKVARPAPAPALAQ